MTKGINMLKNCFAEGKMNERTKGGCGNIAKKEDAGRKKNGGDGQGRASLERGAEGSNVTSKRNGVTRYRFSHITRAITKKVITFPISLER
jgi:hypothetical protein